jgi:multiple sugar transport system substrate-binding protein
MRTPATALFLLIILTIAACTSLPISSPTDVPTDVGTTIAPSPEVTASLPSQPMTITMWVASDFAPDPTTVAGTLLYERLTAYEQANPGINIIVRVKDRDGPGGLLETLAAANTAAPAALPDLIALDPIALNIATVKELLSPLDGLMEKPTAPEWYDHAIAASHVGGGFFGLPFASEAEILAYRTFSYPSAPQTWSDILAGPSPFLFPAGDPDATFTLIQYLALKGPLFDESGRPSLDPAILTDILAFYGTAHASNILAPSASQYTSANDTWSAFRAEKALSAVAPLSTLLKEGEFKFTSAIPLPTRIEPGASFTETWSWAVVVQDPARQEIVSQLLQWLTQPEFLGPWTYSLGLLPPTASALALWPEGPESALASSLVTLAVPLPSAEVLATFGTPLRIATVSVLQYGAMPSSAALTAAKALQSPETE